MPLCLTPPQPPRDDDDDDDENVPWTHAMTAPVLVATSNVTKMHTNLGNKVGRREYARAARGEGAIACFSLSKPKKKKKTAFVKKLTIWYEY